jgi:hypothetical protein
MNMATPLEYITQNKLDWQSTFKGETSVSGRLGYRGSLVITEGKVLSADKQLPPKATLKQAIMTANSTGIEFVAGELETMDFFVPFAEKYKDYLSNDGVNILYIVDLDKDVTVIYEGVRFHAFVLDESSVWNELLELADLPKSELKRMDAAEKIDAVADAAKAAAVSLPEVTPEAFFALKSGTVREKVGAV